MSVAAKIDSNSVSERRKSDVNRRQPTRFRRRPIFGRSEKNRFLLFVFFVFFSLKIDSSFLSKGFLAARCFNVDQNLLRKNFHVFRPKTKPNIWLVIGRPMSGQKNAEEDKLFKRSLIRFSLFLCLLDNRRGQLKLTFLRRCQCRR